MSIKQSKLFIQQFDDMVNKSDMSIIDKIFAPHFVAHVPLLPRLSRSSFIGFLELFYTAFPDFVMEVDSSVITHNQLVLRITCYGTHKGNFLGIAPTGTQIMMPGICIFQIKDDLAVENWIQFDIFGVIRQMSDIKVTEQLQLLSLN